MNAHRNAFHKDPYHDYTAVPGGSFLETRYIKEQIRMDKAVRSENSFTAQQEGMQFMNDLMRASIYIFIAIAGMTVLRRTIS